MLKTTCDICGNDDDNTFHTAREMMFGYRETFIYLECAACGCLQCRSVPEDPSPYYDNGYQSTAPKDKPGRPLYAAMKRARTRAYLGGSGLIGRALLRKFGPPGLPDWVKRAGMRQESSILAAGCGSGDLLQRMASEGFRNLSGADPFIAESIKLGRHMTIHKAQIRELDGHYDFVVLEHAFEHLADPHATIRRLQSLLGVNGTLIISIPLLGQAWDYYGVNWVQLDAPRHLYLHTERSFRLLSRSMEIDEVVYDSGAFQFWGSEQYAMDIPLLDQRSYRTSKSDRLFSPRAIAEFKRRAAELNRIGAGDQATFYLRNPTF